MKKREVKALVSLSFLVTSGLVSLFYAWWAGPLVWVGLTGSLYVMVWARLRYLYGTGQEEALRKLALEELGELLDKKEP